MALVLAVPGRAETLRIAVFAAPLSRDGPGLLLRDILRAEDDQIAATVAIIAQVDPDILLLTDVDHDTDLVALTALAEMLNAAGAPYPHRFALRSNAGMATGLDLDGNGRAGEPRDAQGYGRFAGDGGLALLSRYPVQTDAVRDLSGLLWRDLPGATLPMVDDAPFPSAEAQAVQRLGSTGHWVVPVSVGDRTLTLMAWSATPPVFDGPEDRNGLRNRDELRLWQVLLDGGLGASPAPPFVILGNAQLDPVDGDGINAAMVDLLADPRLQDPAPLSEGGRLAADPDHRGDPALDTADWDGPGNLRVAYVLPSSDLRVTGSGVFWPAPDRPEARLLGDDGLAAGPHRLVWVDILP
ncbi:MAG: Endonuclease/Exonuclease/phosphatase family [Rhodobacteraceae bacterium HLUCCA08]|nr:MAG: Endonuclease/Exonuclease/phosphatase family [Rhodobacteraceae bacterium HLUCCA08]